MQQRYMDPIAGRFLSVDPVTTDVTTGGHFNRYAYADNNPLTLVDPDGRVPTGCTGTTIKHGCASGIAPSFSGGISAGSVPGPAGQAVQAANGGGMQVSSDSARTWGSYLPGTESGESAAQYWANKHVETGNGPYMIPGLLASLWMPNTAAETATTLLGVGAGSIGVRLGREITFGKNFRIAPFGNRTGHPQGELSHYHRRGVDPVTGGTKPGQGIGRHRPWCCGRPKTDHLTRAVPIQS